MAMKDQIQSFLRRFPCGQEGHKWVICFCVWNLQVVGSFPYTWPGPPHQPQFCPLLCAWSVFLKIYCWLGVYACFLVVGVSLSDWKDNDLNGIIYNVSVMVYVCAYSQPHLVMLAKSRTLANILSRFPPFEEPLSRRSRVSTLILLQVIFLDILVPAFALSLPSVSSLAYRLLLMFFAILSGHACFCVYILFKALSVALSAYLFDAVEEALSPSLSGRGVTASLSLPPLFLLEQKIRKVSDKRHRRLMSDKLPRNNMDLHTSLGIFQYYF